MTRFDVKWSDDSIDPETRAAADAVIHELLDVPYDRYMTMLHRLFVRSLVRPTRLPVLCDHVTSSSRPA